MARLDAAQTAPEVAKAPCLAPSGVGTECLSFRRSLNTRCFARPKSAIPAQPVAPQRPATKPATSRSQRSWHPLSASGSGFSLKVPKKMSMRGTGSRRAIPAQDSVPTKTARPSRSGQMPNAIPLQGGPAMLSDLTGRSAKAMVAVFNMGGSGVFSLDWPSAEVEQVKACSTSK
jgi:hypothetical protein